MQNARTLIDTATVPGSSPDSVIDELGVLRAVKSRLEAIANHLPAMIGYWNRELRCEFANDAYLEWFGLPPRKVIGMLMVELQGEKLFRLNEPHARMALSGQAQRFEREIRKADGSVGYTDARYIPDLDEAGNVRGFFVLVSDITELHQAYSRVRELAQRLESAREEERRAVALTLHEGIAQDLFASTLALKHLKSVIERSGDGEAAVDVVSALIEQCIEHTRQLAGDLHPPSLGQLTLLATLESHARYFESLTGLRIHVAEVGPFPVLDESAKLMFFRAAQEALTNVVRHAQARTVNIVLRADRDTAAMDITDDGIGVPDDVLVRPRSLGLLGIRERFQAAGGGLKVARNAPAGTRLSVHLPNPGRRL
jgi:PAS domain S-box-containing protein